MYLSFLHTPSGPMATDIANLIASGDPRFGMPPMETLMARTLEEVKAWLTPQLTHGALDISGAHVSIGECEKRLPAASDLANRRQETGSEVAVPGDERANFRIRITRLTHRLPPGTA
jgi:hypothetical protein